jgi:hypothetical protein
MLVLALQFSRDVAVGDTGDALTCVARGGMDREREHGSLTTEQERPATRVPVVP